MDALLLFVILVGLYSSGHAQQHPMISYITKERVVSIGDNMDLSCSVQYAAQYSVIWVKVNKDDPSSNLFISTGSLPVVPDQRYSIRHDPASSTYTLQISKIQEIDAGTYQCQVVISSTNKVTAEVKVYVRIPPIISDNSTRTIIASAGETISLHCYADGYPTPKVSFRRDNNDILPTGGAVHRGNILTFHRITKDDRGTYYCIADNGVGKGARRSISVEVEFPPFITTDRPRYGQALQHPMDLMCHVEAFPSPTISWLKDGYEIHDNQYYKVSIFATADEFTDTILRVKNIEKKQYGNYTCKAFNKLGSDQKVIELFETVNIVCPPACDALRSNINPASIVSPSIAVFLLLLATVVVTSN